MKSHSSPPLQFTPLTPQEADYIKIQNTIQQFQNSPKTTIYYRAQTRVQSLQQGNNIPVNTEDLNIGLEQTTNPVNPVTNTHPETPSTATSQTPPISDTPSNNP